MNCSCTLATIDILQPPDVYYCYREIRLLGTSPTQMVVQRFLLALQQTSFVNVVVLPTWHTKRVLWQYSYSLYLAVKTVTE